MNERVDVVHVSLPTAGEPRAMSELERELGALRHGFAEICVDIGGFPVLTALVNGDVGWLMLQRYDGDAGFSSRNVAYLGDPRAVVSYTLSNGQIDEYPRAWTYSRTRILDAVRHFGQHGRVPDDIAWFNDSGDGAASPSAAAGQSGRVR